MGIQIISYHCHLKNRMGRTISSTIVRDVLLDPDNPQIPLKALSEGLRDIKKNEVRQILLRAHEAYGPYDPTLVKTQFLEDIDLRYPPEMDEKIFVIQDGVSVAMKVIQLSSDTVTLDGNHPLAGQDLIFEIQALEVRDATVEEIRAIPKDQSMLH